MPCRLGVSAPVSVTPSTEFPALLAGASLWSAFLPGCWRQSWFIGSFVAGIGFMSGVLCEFTISRVPSRLTPWKDLEGGKQWPRYMFASSCSYNCICLLDRKYNAITISGGLSCTVLWTCLHVLAHPSFCPPEGGQDLPKQTAAVRSPRPSLQPLAAPILLSASLTGDSEADTPQRLVDTASSGFSVLGSRGCVPDTALTPLPLLPQDWQPESHGQSPFVT